MAIKWLVTRHWVLTLLIMCLCALGMGIFSYDLFHLFKGNIELISDSSNMLFLDGGLQQFLELCMDGIISVIFYVIFKACEKVLVEKILK